MNKLGNILMLLSFLLFICGFGIYSFISEDRTVSSWENRSLAQKPALTLDSVIDGTYMSSYETYFTDQFPYRDLWMKAHVLIENYTNKTYVNNYYITDDNTILKQPEAYVVTESIDKSIEQMDLLGDTAKAVGSELYFFYLPSRIISLDELYPEFIDKGYTAFSKDYLYNGIENKAVQKLDLTKMLTENYSIKERRKLFYQTDHHWNEDGALKGYEFIRNTLSKQSSSVDVEPFNAVDYTKVCSNHLNFVGSYNLQVYNVITGHRDTPCHYVSSQLNYDEDYKVISGNISSGAEVKASSIFGTKMKNTKGNITYAEVFMQDLAEINIINNVKVNDGESSKVLIIKDSFANAVNFLMAENFAYTSILDIRYYKAGTIEQYIKENEFDTIIILYNGETIYKSMYNFDGTAN